jgi:hypothetical protein
MGSITNFQISVVDLNLLDGIEAGYVLSNRRIDLSTGASTYLSSGDPKQLLDSPGDAELRSAFAGATAMARLSEGSFFVEGAGPASTHVVASVGDWFQLVNIFPNTQLNFTADVSLITSGVGVLGAGIHLTKAFGSGNPSTQYDLVAGGGESKSERANFSFDWTGVDPNSGDDVWTGELRTILSGDIGIVDEPPPVLIPEPQEHALLLAGLAAVAAAARYRRAQAGRPRR